VEVARYIQYFQWDFNNYAMDKPLAVLGAKVVQQMKQSDEKLRKLMDEKAQISQ